MLPENRILLQLKNVSLENSWISTSWDTTVSKQATANNMSGYSKKRLVKKNHQNKKLILGKCPTSQLAPPHRKTSENQCFPMFSGGREQKLRYWLKHRLNSINGGTYENYLLLLLFCLIRSANLPALQFRT